MPPHRGTPLTGHSRWQERGTMRLSDLSIRALPVPSNGAKLYYDNSALPGFGVRVSRGGTRTFVLVHGRDRQYTKIWAGALKAARRLEKKYGKENLGPYSKLDWGMINGKLSALRWIYGDEWDALYT